MNKKRVLVFPGGTEIGLEIQKSLKDCKDIILYSAGSPISNHAEYVFKNNLAIPDIHDRGWEYYLNKIIYQNRIDYVFPAHDSVILALSHIAGDFHTNIISSPLKTCAICRSKSWTYNIFKELLPVPKIFYTAEKIKSFPIFVKPDDGQGAEGAYKVNNIIQLKGLIDNNPNLIMMEYLPGKEFTVDCFTDRKKGLLFCRGRERVRIRRGISMNSKPVDEDTNRVFKTYANIISKELKLCGAWFFQVKVSSNYLYKLLEIAPRIGGTAGMHRALGVNLPLLSIYEHEGRDIKIMPNKHDIEIDRALVNRYKHNIKYNKVYVDLDDTLIVHGKINTQLMRLLYQAVNNKCKIVLITKTKNNLGDIMRKWRLGRFFDTVISLKEGENKADFIDSEGAIFIDDSFKERKQVAEVCHIPTFDCSMLELLIDDRS